MKWKKVLLVVIIIVLIFAVSGWLYFKYKQKTSEVKLAEEEKILQERTQQLQKIKDWHAANPPTQEDLGKRVQKLEQLRLQAATSTKLINQQLQERNNELNKLRNK